MSVEITAPGVYDIPEHLYHADPVPGGSLSSTGARRLLPPSCPAIFDYERRHGRPPSKAFDYGHAAHRMVLGTGPEIVAVDAADWRTKSAREQRDEAHAAGRVPLLAHEAEQVRQMADAIRRHPIASVLLDPATGSAEQTLVWIDDETGVWCRARLDFLRDRAGGRTIVVDYKTTVSVDRASIRRAVYHYGYHQQDAWYLDGVRALLAHEAEPAFLFVFQQKTPPYLVTVAELDERARAVARADNDRARRIYAECVRTGRWPGHSDDIELIDLPAWAGQREEYAA